LDVPSKQRTPIKNGKVNGNALMLATLLHSISFQEGEKTGFSFLPRTDEQ